MKVGYQKSLKEVVPSYCPSCTICSEVKMDPLSYRWWHFCELKVICTYCGHRRGEEIAEDRRKCLLGEEGYILMQTDGLLFLKKH